LRNRIAQPRFAQLAHSGDNGEADPDGARLGRQIATDFLPFVDA
jgi:hypothetical protein